MPIALRQTVLDTTDVRGLAEFYRQLLGLVYRAGDEVPADALADVADWLCLRTPGGQPLLAFQQVSALPRVEWGGAGQAQLHLDIS